MNHSYPPAQKGIIPADTSSLLDKLADVVPDILFIMNLYSKQLLYINRPPQNLLGYNESQLSAMHHPFFDVIYPDDLPIVLDHLEEMKNAGENEVREITYRMVDAQGNLRWFRDLNAVFRVDEKGKAVEKTGVISEITAQKKNEEEILRQAQTLKEAERKITELNRDLSAKNHSLNAANSELKTFGSIAAHEYKETLEKLYTNLEYILSTDARNLSDSGKGNLRRMQSAIQKMKLLTDDMVSFSRLQTLEEVRTEADLDGILSKAIADLDKRLKDAGATIEADALPKITGYPLLLTLLFYHLLDNAIKFCNAELKPCIKIKYAQQKAVAPGDEAELLYHRVSFVDEGVGFPPEEAENIFSMFYRVEGQTKKRGTGIGLAVCRKIMDIHHGFIKARSGDGETMFCCFFPVQQ